MTRHAIAASISPRPAGEGPGVRAAAVFPISARPDSVIFDTPELTADQVARCRELLDVAPFAKHLATLITNVETP